MKNNRKMQMTVGHFKDILFNNLDYGVKSMVDNIPREEVLIMTACQMIDIANTIAELKNTYGMSDAAVEKVMVTIFKEWDKVRIEKWRAQLEAEYGVDAMELEDDEEFDEE